MGSNNYCRPVSHLETIGRLTALVPIVPTKNSPTRRLCYRFTLNYPLLFLSILIIITQTIWDIDNLDLSMIKGRSGKIHAAIFQIALWYSSAIGRMAFLLTAPFCFNLFKDLQDYMTEYILTKRPGALEKVKAKRCGYKVICLSILNFIYIAQMLEYLYREFLVDREENSSDPNQGVHGGYQGHEGYQGHGGDEYHKGHEKTCKRWLISCDSKLIISIISVAFKFISSETLYYLTYLVIIISDLFILILTEFENDVLTRLGFITENFDPSPESMFVLKKTGGQKGQSPERQKDLQEQFSRLKDLFSQFNLALGFSLFVSFLADIMIMICMAYSLIPNLKYNNQGQWGMGGGGQGSNSKDNFTHGEVHAQGIIGGGQGSINGTNFTLGEQHVPDLSAAFGASYLRPEEHGIFITDAIHYVFGILHECRTVLMAAIGSYLKYKVNDMKSKLEKKEAERSSGSSVWGREIVNESYETSENVRGARKLCKRVAGWSWEFRSLDMFTCDLALLPTMFGTIMTYVVVLLQIRLSEDPF